MHAELSRRPCRQWGVQDVLVHRRALVGLVLVGLAQRLDVDRGAVQGGRDGLGQEGAVVVGVVPGKRALVAAILPEALQELHRLERLLGVDRHGLAVGLDFLAAPRPQIGIGEGGRIAERMAERLADRVALGLQLLGRVTILRPGLGEGSDAHFVEPRLAIGDHAADHRPWHAHEHLAVAAQRAAVFVEPALGLADALGQVGEVDHAVGVDVGVVVERLDQVGAGARLDRRGGARLQVVAVYRLEVDLDAQRFLGLGHQLLAHQLVRRGNEVDPAQPVNRLLLGVGGRAARGENAGHAGRRHGSRAAGKLDNAATLRVGHVVLPGRAASLGGV